MEMQQRERTTTLAWPSSPVKGQEHRSVAPAEGLDADEDDAEELVEEKAAADEEDGEVVVEEEDDNEKKQKKKKESEDEAPTTKLQQTPRSQVTGLRIYVHKLSERFDHDALVKRYPKCSSFQWANDLRLVRYIMQSPVHTKDATAANFFLVPFLAKCWFNYVAKYRLDRMDHDVKELLNELDRTESWQRHAKRHMFLFVSGAGPTLFRSWQSIRHASFLLAEGDRAAGIYKDARDIVIPGVSVVVPPPPSRDPHRPRRLLASFRGNLIAHMRDAEGKDLFRRSVLRIALVELAKGRDDLVVEDRLYLEADRKTYLRELEDSIFCLIPRGITPWTRRLFDAMLSDCIPVVLSNAIVFPFERTLDYSGFTIKIPEAWAGRLWSLLNGISAKEVLALQRRIREVAPYFSAAKGQNPFDSVLEQLAAMHATPMQGRTFATRNGAGTFWMPGRGVFELSGNDAKQVGPSYGGGALPHPAESELWQPDAEFVRIMDGKLGLAAEPPWWWLKYKAPKDWSADAGKKDKRQKKKKKKNKTE